MRGLSDLNNAGGGGAAAGGGAGGGGCSDCIKNTWANTPFWTRGLFIISTTVYGLSWILPVNALMVCDSHYVVFKIQIWRVITGLFVHGQLLTLLFAMLSHLPHANTAEKTMGTVRYFFRFWMCGIITLTLFSLVCALVNLEQLSIGLWPMFFVDLVIECMAQPEAVTGLCCLPIQIKRKWYPLILIAIFTLLFPNIAMWFGLAVGYAYHYGFFKRIELGANKATVYENKWPFKNYKEKPYFVQAGAAMGGTILPSFRNAMDRNASAASSSQADQASSAPASSSSANANFKSFGGRGTSIGGTPVRAAAAPASAPQPSLQQQQRSGGGSQQQQQQRPGSALIAKLEEKKKAGSGNRSQQSSDLTTTETEVGHDMDPDDSEPVRASDDKSDDAVYGKINETDNSM